VNITDAIDIGWDLSGRRLKSWIARGFLCLMLLCPSVGIAALSWYATHRGQQIQHEIERVVVPRLMPSSGPRP
jgi:hypothetical protein